ncbi:hypothetical protein JB92DRAFT_3132481 [Gautieria morchelliformis]|nr:hypothetical protein JB92DRAFT_3132481 [Gautieria morchelliformis]
MVLLPTFPDLPGPGPPSRWGHNINRAHQVISRSYLQALRVLHREDGDSLHIKYHLDFIQGRIFHLLGNLGPTQLPEPWLKTCAQCLGHLLVELASAQKGAEDNEPNTVSRMELVTTIHIGWVGRPTKRLNMEWMQDVVSGNHRLSLQLLSQLLGIHRNTLRYKLQEMGLSRRFSTLNDIDLDLLLKLYKQLRPNSGL